MLNKKSKLLLTPEAHDNLFKLFCTKTQHTQYRNLQQQIYDGLAVQVYAPTTYTSSEGLSHALNTLSDAFSPADWIDNRTPQQTSQCNMQLQPPPTFKSHRHSVEYYQTHQAHTYTALWSDKLPIDYLDKENEDGNLQQTKTRLYYELSLSTRALQHYAWIARHHKMRPPTLTNRSSLSSQSAASLEAIGIGWLLPPIDYQQILDDTPNLNKARPNARRTNTSKKYGNPNHIPYVYDPNKWPVFTPQRAKELLEKLNAQENQTPNTIT